MLMYLLNMYKDDPIILRLVLQDFYLINYLELMYLPKIKRIIDLVFFILREDF